MKPSAKAVIINSFKQLVEKKNIDKITVKEICELSDVNRQTFYNHFQDIFDIFKYIFQEEVFSEIAQNRTFETWCGGFLATLHYLKQNSKMILHVYESSYRAEANSFFTRLSNRLLEDVVEECIERRGTNIQDEDRRFIVNFYRHVFNGLMMDWVNEGMKEDPEQLLQKLQTMIIGSIPRSVDAFTENEKNLPNYK